MARITSVYNRREIRPQTCFGFAEFYKRLKLPQPASNGAFRNLIMNGILSRSRSAAFLFGVCLFAPGAARASLNVPPGAAAGLEKLYAGDPDAAIEEFQSIQREQPEHPLGYLLEAEARWWKIYCESAEFKYGMTDAWKRNKQREDAVYLQLIAKEIKLAEAQLAKSQTAEAHFYAGMGYALRSRILALFGEHRGSARAGVRAREHLLRALALEPDLADADLGLGLYNYYVDTLSAIAKVLRFFMGIPGGSKKEGIRQLERAMTQGVLVREDARFYLAKNLRNYDQQYQRALEILEPLVRQYPSNPAFLFLQGDLYAKLNRKPQAAESFRAAAALPLRDPNCRQRIAELARASLAALGLPATSPAN